MIGLIGYFLIVIMLNSIDSINSFRNDRGKRMYDKAFDKIIGFYPKHTINLLSKHCKDKSLIQNSVIIANKTIPNYGIRYTFCDYLKQHYPQHSCIKYYITKSEVEKADISNIYDSLSNNVENYMTTFRSTDYEHEYKKTNREVGIVFFFSDIVSNRLTVEVYTSCNSYKSIFWQGKSDIYWIIFDNNDNITGLYKGHKHYD